MAHAPKTEARARPRKKAKSKRVEWNDTEPRAHVLSEGKGGTEGKREEARGDERQGRSALRLG